MQLGFVGLGKMGLNMVTRLVRGGHEVVAYDRSADAVGARRGRRRARRRRRSTRSSTALAPPRAVWVMVPAGDADRIDRRRARPRCCRPATSIIDGGNTNFTTMCGARETLAAKRIHYVDAGTSGGIWGLQEGYCLMVGGEADVCRRLEPIFLTLAPQDGYLRVGDHGAGHYVKMIHNGIEYGLMQAYAEGFELMHASDYKIDLAARRRALDARQRRAIVAAGADRARARRRRRAWRRSKATSRIPAKGAGRCTKAIDRARAAAGADGGAVHPLPIARGQPVRRAAARGAAQPVRRPRREDAMPDGAMPLTDAGDARPATADRRRAGHARDLRRRRRPRAPQAAAGALQPARRRPAAAALRRSSASAATTMTDDAYRDVRQGRHRRSSRGGRSTSSAGGRSPQSLFFVNASLDDPQAFATLGARLDIIEHERGLPGNRIYYLAVPPTLFVPTVEQLARGAVRRAAPDARRSRG